MAFRKTRRVSKKKPLLATAPKRVLKAAVNSAKVRNIKRIVKSVMRKDQEVKKVYNTDIANSLSIPGAGVDFGPQTMGFTTVSLIPNPNIGTSSAARVGNQITPVRLNVRYSLMAKPSTDSTSAGGNTNPFVCLPFFVKVVVYRHRYSTSDSSPLGIINDGATSGNLTSSVDSFFRPYNRDEFIIAYSKIHKLTPQRHQLSGVAGVNLTGQSQDPYTTSYAMRSFNLKLPKHLLYNDNASAYPTNAAWYASVAVCNADGTAITAIQSRVVFNCESYLMFTDD